jgi:TolB-like protein/DNA-binding winged helix-turn-helix (wHTH) protein/Tfp pilus assembly protein PilF
MSDNGKGIYEFSGYRLDVPERLLLRGTERIQIPDKPFEVLCVLASRSGRLVGKDELISEVWGDTIVEENNLDKSISLLRNILGERTGKEKFIETVRGHGYRFVPQTLLVETERPSRTSDRSRPHSVPRDDIGPTSLVIHSVRPSTNVVALAEWHATEAPLKDLDGENDVQPRLAAVPPVKRRFDRRVIVLPLVAITLLAAVAIGYFGFLRARPGISSLAVLPFVNASQDTDAEYLSDGITESIINNLSALSGTKVMSRSSAFRFRENQNDVRHIASQLGVEALVTGDIKQVGERLVINVRLINAADESQIWGNQYVRTPVDMIAVQNDIASDISLHLGARLSGSDITIPRKKYSANPEAYKAYLKGRYHFEKFTARDARKALEYFQDAVRLDANFADAYANIAAVYSGVAGAKDFPRGETALKAKENALKAVQLDGQLSTAHEVYGAILYQQDRDYVAAERELKRAIELDPNDASIHETYGGLLTQLGRHREAMAEVKLAEEINPLSSSVSTSVGMCYLYGRHYDEAVEQLLKSLELDAYSPQTHYGLAIAYQMQQKYAESLEERAKLTEIAGNPQGAAFIRESFARGGWEGYLRAMTENDQAPLIPLYVKAVLFAELGARDRAFEILKQLFEDKSPQLSIMKVDPRVDSLRDDPRFADLLRGLNLE